MRGIKNEWFNESNKNLRYRSLIKNIHDDYIDTVEFKSGMFENGIIKLTGLEKDT